MAYADAGVSIKGGKAAIREYVENLRASSDAKKINGLQGLSAVVSKHRDAIFNAGVIVPLAVLANREDNREIRGQALALFEEFTYSQQNSIDHPANYLAITLLQPVHTVEYPLGIVFNAAQISNAPKLPKELFIELMDVLLKDYAEYPGFFSSRTNEAEVEAFLDEGGNFANIPHYLYALGQALQKNPNPAGELVSRLKYAAASCGLDFGRDVRPLVAAGVAGVVVSYDRTASGSSASVSPDASGPQLIFTQPLRKLSANVQLDAEELKL